MTNSDPKKLTPQQKRVLHERGTEQPFTGEYLHNKEAGIYHCADCGNQLFTSETKFDSGTGWPSFTDVQNSDAVILKEDSSHGMRRTEVLCKKCSGHLGHVFPDGPSPNSQRFCINSCALDFKKED